MQLQVREFVPVPTGDYPAKIKTVEVNDKGQFGPQLRWIMDIGKVADINGDVDEFENRTLSYFTPMTISGANKLSSLIRAAGFEIPAAGETFDTDSLIGKPVLLAVTRGISKKDGATPVNNIDSVTRYVPKNVNGAAPAPVQAPTTESELPF